MTDTAEPSLASLRRIALARLLRRRCPQCGTGPLFRGYARLLVSCPECGLVYRREQGAQTGSMYLTAAITQVFAVGLIALCWVVTDWSAAIFLAVSIPVLLAFCAWFLPVAQALWIGVEYVTDAINGEEWVRPRRPPPLRRS